MIKKYIIFSIILLTSFFGYFSYSSEWNAKTPDKILDWLKDKDIQSTSLDNVSWKWIKNTLSSVKSSPSWYIQWLWFIWLTIALFLIIYNGMYLLWNFWSEDKMWKVKKRLLSLIIWVLVLTTWYLIIKLVVSLVWWIFN